jgi:hypothetical protein
MKAGEEMPHMAYRMPEKMEDEFENGHGFRSSDMRAMAILLIFWLVIAIVFVNGILLIGPFLIITGTLTYYMLLPNKKGKHGSSKHIRNWQIYYNYLFQDKNTYKPMNLEEDR